MKKKTSTIFTLALAAMLGMGVAEANAQRVVYKGTATINQKDGTSTKFDVSSLRQLFNTENYARVTTEEYGKSGYFENVDNVSFDWVAKTIGEIKIDYKKEISGEELKQAVKDMRTQLGSALKAVYGMRGGKEGGPPQAHAYQFAYNLGPDSYVQYFCVPHYDFPYANFTLRSTYDLCKGCLDGPGVSFRAMKYDMVPTLNAEKIDYMPELKAIYLMLFNYSAIENVDLFGPMPYNDHKNYVEESPFVYDRVKDIYYQAKANIDAAIECFKYYKGHRSDTYKEQIGRIILSRVQLLSSDYTDASDLSVWIRFANSLKLRMAIHMSKVEPATAKQWAEEAVAGGVIENEADEIGLFPSLLGSAHPLIEIMGWNDIVMGASFINLLQNLDHPYMKYLFTKNSIALEKSKQAVSGTSAPAVTPKGSVYVGMRNGVTPGEWQAAANNPYAGYSMLDRTYFSECNPPLYLMKVSEVNFLRAEGALRGWNMGGTAQSFYEQGIRTAYLEDRNFPIIAVR